MAGGAQTTATVTIDTEYTATEAGPMPLCIDGHVTTTRELSVTGASTPT
ncbi:hypothetical protein ACFQL1_23140 [Halomicroarcula sp. GCM10025709]|nr:hypothetical protein [Halomicroarcula sp. YJ-61-S]